MHGSRERTADWTFKKDCGAIQQMLPLHINSTDILEPEKWEKNQRHLSGDSHLHSTLIMLANAATCLCLATMDEAKPCLAVAPAMTRKRILPSPLIQFSIEAFPSQVYLWNTRMRYNNADVNAKPSIPLPAAAFPRADRNGSQSVSPDLIHDAKVLISPWKSEALSHSTHKPSHGQLTFSFHWNNTWKNHDAPYL